MFCLLSGVYGYFIGGLASLWLVSGQLDWFVALWCSGYHYCTTSFNWAWTQVLPRFKSCFRCLGDSRWWGSLTMDPFDNKDKRLSFVNHTTRTIHQHHHHHHHIIIVDGLAGLWVVLSFTAKAKTPDGRPFR